MVYFTPDELSPSATSLNIIRQMAYTYRTRRTDGKVVIMCTN